jgi:guanosine-3',5'-bis(diphosphate) 3'-pyrophosphohydrolase
VPAVSRVLPWRRHNAPVAEETAALVAAYHSRHPRASTDLITKAFELAATLHRGQTRRSGEPYIQHPLAVAEIVARLGLDETTIAAAVLHDVVEDTDISLADIERDFGAEVAYLVDGCTKLDRLQFDTKEQQQSATIRKMIVAIAQDLRVIIIKLADRLHNMRTLAVLPVAKQERIARETLDIYSPLAHRLGMQEVKQQLEDLAFSALHPKRYGEIDQMVQSRAPERDEYLARVIDNVNEHLVQLSITAEVTGRPKHLWSIYEKMVVKGRSFDEIYDLIGIRIVVDTVKDCYAALGSIHAMWKPVQGRFKDYIAMPKFNLYQSLHTTVVGPQGKPIEVQIRTWEMNARAEYGVAAHWEYKDRRPGSDMAWLSRIVEWQQETSDPNQFMADLKVELESDEVFVFTPKGRVVNLPVGATPVDFAYAIHTEVGHKCIGARVNGRLVPLDTRLQSGDTAEIFTSKVENAGPTLDWLKFVVTHRAASKIKQWRTRERREDAKETGRDDLVKALRREGLPVQQLMRGEVFQDVLTTMNYVDADSLYTAIGDGHVSAKTVVARVGRALREGDTTNEERVALTVFKTRKPRRHKGSVGVHVEGLDDVMIRLSRCCTPVPPDAIMGFVTRGRGVSVHRTDCANAVTLADSQGDRLIEVEWDAETPDYFVASIEIKALDRPWLLRDVAAVLADHQVNVLSCNTVTGSDRVAKMRFEFELGDVSHLESMLRSMKDVDSVYDAYRVVQGGGS